MHISWKISISPQVPAPHYSSTPEWVSPPHRSTSQCWQTQNWLLELWSSCPSCWAPPPWSTPSICCWPARCWLLERATGMKYLTLIWITWEAVSVGDDHNSDWSSWGVEEEGEKEIVNLLLKSNMWWWKCHKKVRLSQCSTVVKLSVFSLRKQNFLTEI